MNTAIILSGGTGLRLGSEIPKQYIKVKDQMILSYCLHTILNNDHITRLVIVAHKSWRADIQAELNKQFPDQLSFIADSGADPIDSSMEVANVHTRKTVAWADPGENRQLSILSALLVIDAAGGTDTVLIHDAARPNLSAAMIDQCYDALSDHDGVLPVLPMKDTVYLSRDGKEISQLLNRNELFAGQAPELFVFDKYLNANKALLPDKILSINGSTEPAIMAGMNIAMIPGDEHNYKITSPADLVKFTDENS